MKHQEIKKRNNELETAAEKNMSDKDKGKQKLKDLGLSDDEIKMIIQRSRLCH